VIVVGTELSVLIIVATRDLLSVVIVCAALLLLAVAAARSALRPTAEPNPPREISVPAPPRQPFLIMNPHSGGGKVERFHLREKAESLGAEVTLLEGPGNRRCRRTRPRSRQQRGRPARGSPVVTARKRWSPGSRPNMTCRCS